MCICKLAKTKVLPGVVKLLFTHCTCISIHTLCWWLISQHTKLISFSLLLTDRRDEHVLLPRRLPSLRWPAAVFRNVNAGIAEGKQIACARQRGHECRASSADRLKLISLVGSLVKPTEAISQVWESCHSAFSNQGNQNINPSHAVCVSRRVGEVFFFFLVPVNRGWLSSYSSRVQINNQSEEID